MTRLVKRAQVDPLTKQEQETLIAAHPYLWSLLQVCDSVFAHPDAFAPEAINISLGRIYRQWKETAKGLNPEFDSKKHRLENSNGTDNDSHS